MHMYQGKGGGVQFAEALTWVILNYEYQNSGKSIHESTTKSPTNTPLWILPRLTHEEAHHSTHAYLASFRSIHSSCLIIRYRFQVVHDRERGYSNSLLTLQGCKLHTHNHQLTPFARHRSRGDSQDVHHDTSLTTGLF